MIQLYVLMDKKKMLNTIMEGLEKFYVVSGLKMNTAKTQIVLICSQKYQEDKNLSENKVQ